jgi:hypothetical protein
MGIREDTGDSPVKVYRRWLRDVKGCSDDEVDRLSEKEFSDSLSGEDDEEGNWDDWELGLDSQRRKPTRGAY